MYVRMHACMCVIYVIYVMYVCMYVCVYVCVFTHACIYAGI
jgi:hypothetical protein